MTTTDGPGAGGAAATGGTGAADPATSLASADPRVPVSAPGAADGGGAPWALSGARAMGLTRVALGVTALVAPGLPLWPWIGRSAARARPARLLARALGARDVALGLGLVMALRRGAPARGWVEAGGLADLGDATITLLSFRSLPRRSRWAVLAAAGGGAVVAPIVARGLTGLTETTELSGALPAGPTPVGGAR